jgi:hypothetical protein
MNGRENPAQPPAGGEMIPPDSLTLPLRSLTAAEIERAADDFLNTALEIHEASDLYVYVKQMEAAVEALKDRLIDPAFNSIGNRFGGSNTGEILGHKVALSWPEKWVYPKEVNALVDQQKLDLKAAQAKAQADGTAKKETQKGRITVTIKKG